MACCFLHIISTFCVLGVQEINVVEVICFFFNLGAVYFTAQSLFDG